MCVFKIPLDVWAETKEGSNSREPQTEHIHLYAQLIHYHAVTVKCPLQVCILSVWPKAGGVIWKVLDPRRWA